MIKKKINSLFVIFLLSYFLSITLIFSADAEADKDFDQAIYPDRNHGIYGGKTRIHIYKKMTKFDRKIQY